MAESFGSITLKDQNLSLVLVLNLQIFVIRHTHLLRLVGNYPKENSIPIKNYKILLIGRVVFVFENLIRLDGRFILK